jgi:hypothetical protein
MEKPIPYYDREGWSRGFRTLEAARLLIHNGLVTGAYGRKRKGHLKAIYGKREDGSCAMERQPTCRHALQFHRATGAWALLEVATSGLPRRGWHASQYAWRLPSGDCGLRRRMKAKGQVGGRHIARDRSALRGGQARLRQPVGQPANLALRDAIPRATARTGAKRLTAPRSWVLPSHFFRPVEWSHKVSS